MGFMTEISPKYYNIKAITCLNNDFQPFFFKIGTKNLYDKKFKIYSVKYLINLSLKFTTC